MRLRYAEWRDRLETLIARAQAEGDVAQAIDAGEAAAALIALIDGIGVQVVLGLGRLPAARQREMFDSWLETVAPAV